MSDNTNEKITQIKQVLKKAGYMTPHALAAMEMYNYLKDYNLLKKPSSLLKDDCPISIVPVSDFNKVKKFLDFCKVHYKDFAKPKKMTDYLSKHRLSASLRGILVKHKYLETKIDGVRLYKIVDKIYTDAIIYDICSAVLDNDRDVEKLRAKAEVKKEVPKKIDAVPVTKKEAVKVETNRNSSYKLKDNPRTNNRPIPKSLVGFYGIFNPDFESDIEIPLKTHTIKSVRGAKNHSPWSDVDIVKFIFLLLQGNDRVTIQEIIGRTPKSMSNIIANMNRTGIIGPEMMEKFLQQHYSILKKYLIPIKKEVNGSEVKVVAEPEPEKPKELKLEVTPEVRTTDQVQEEKEDKQVEEYSKEDLIKKVKKLEYIIENDRQAIRKMALLAETLCDDVKDQAKRITNLERAYIKSTL